MSEQPTSKDQRWPLSPERIGELRERAHYLLSTLNVHECQALRDLLDDELPPSMRLTPAPSCLACEDRPGPENSPCLVCGRAAVEPEPAPEVSKLQHALRRASHYLEWAAFHHVTAESAQKLLRIEANAAWPDDKKEPDPRPAEMKMNGQAIEHTCPLCKERLLTLISPESRGVIADSVERSSQPPFAVRDVERHAIWLTLEYTKANPGLDPTARKLLRELHERSAPQPSATDFGDGSVG